MPVQDERDYWIAFSVFPGIGPVRFRELFSFFHSAQLAWNASQDALMRAGLSSRIAERFIRFRHTYDFSGYRAQLRNLGVVPLILTDSQYPSYLKEISDAPFVLYVRGHKSAVPMDLTKTIGIVGARNCTEYGRQIARDLAGVLAREGWVIVSGLAYGIDAAAHQAALDAGGKTIAVLGCGIDIVAPSVNARLYEDIVHGGGAIVAEMPLGHRPSRGLFPARNRIISGLSRGVIVVEGAEDSGSLITARYAAEQGREVFAVPGPITSRLSAGPAKLIRDGARLVTSADDVLSEFGETREKRDKKQVICRSQEEEKIVGVLAAHQMEMDELVATTGLTTQVVSATITILQMRGIVKEYGTNVFGLSR